ncbi:hypothetical protein PENTCL1PPCAC_12212 [Pristionchus entomophagus]|uniref:Thioredoxin domain-containing protein n=1 Tax=Pristionchus entomophagus TaxID=358040 RepID=A0AAV5T4Y8_9BILA|nr:hypothetical protein PENTCL1PPCAC_12212 [Pristionchus entomophagus]
MPVKHVNSDYAFNSEMGKAGTKPVCVDFFAEWCGPCKQIAPFFEQLSAKYPGVVFLKVDVDQCTNAAASNGVQAMPTFMMFVIRTKKDMVRGADSSALESMVRKYATGGGSGGGFGGRGATLAGGMGSSSSSSSGAAPEVDAGEPSLWHNANDRLRTMGVPQLAAGGFVFEPAALVLALASLLFYGPFGPVIVLGLAVLLQTSASPFDRYVPGGGGANPGPTRTQGSAPSGAPAPAPTRAFGGSGRRLGD